MSLVSLLFLSLLVAPPPHATAQPQPIVFQSEEVFLTLWPDALEVEGHYRFVNRTDTPARLGIRFPFPVDGGHPNPALVEADVEGLRLLPAAAAWRLSLGPREVRDVTVRYLQPHDGRSATYITTSALAWKQPLEHARFVARWPRSMGDVHVTLPLEDRHVDGDEIVGIYETLDFVPARDVRLTW